MNNINIEECDFITQAIDKAITKIKAKPTIDIKTHLILDEYERSKTRAKDKKASI